MKTEALPTIENLLADYRPRICALAYIIEDNNPVVCNMGFAVHEEKIILHTSTWTYKWNNLKEGQKVSLAIGYDHLDHYAQVFGRVSKIEIGQPQFLILENLYFNNHPDAVHYRKGQEGILLITPYKVRVGNVINRQVNFQEYDYL